MIADSNHSSRQQPVPSERNRSLSEKCEYSEPHLATGGEGGGVGQLDEAQHEDYTHICNIEGNIMKKLYSSVHDIHVIDCIQSIVIQL
jgi:hypothetical protein